MKLGQYARRNAMFAPSLSAIKSIGVCWSTLEVIDRYGVLNINCLRRIGVWLPSAISTTSGDSRTHARREKIVGVALPVHKRKLIIRPGIRSFGGERRGCSATAYLIQASAATNGE